MKREEVIDVLLLNGFKPVKVRGDIRRKWAYFELGDKRVVVKQLTVRAEARILAPRNGWGFYARHGLTPPTHRRIDGAYLKDIDSTTCLLDIARVTYCDSPSEVQE